MFDDGGSPDDEQAPQRSLASLGNVAKPLLAAGRALSRGKAEPGGEIPAAAERDGWRRQRQHGRGDDRADAGDRHQTAGILVLLCPAGNLAFEAVDLAIERADGLDQHQERVTRRAWQSAVRVLDIGHELGDPGAALRCDPAVFCGQATQGIDELRALANSRSRARNTAELACCASSFTATNRIPGRWAASQIASASRASFFCRLTNGLT